MKVKWKSRPACCMGTMRTVPPLKDGGLEVLQEVLHAEGSGPDLGLDVLEERAPSGVVDPVSLIYRYARFSGINQYSSKNQKWSTIPIPYHSGQRAYVLVPLRPSTVTS